MHLNYYTLKALAQFWDANFRNSLVSDIFSQTRNELSVLLHRAEEEAHTIKISVDPGFRFVFRHSGSGRRRRNVADLFGEACGRRVEAFRTAHRDRILFIDLADGLVLQVQLFGPRPNVFLVAEDRLAGAFRQEDSWLNRPPPPPRPAPEVRSFEAFLERWDASRATVVTALSRTLPLFDKQMAEEAAFRADVLDEEPAALDARLLRTLYERALEVRRECERPAPRIYRRGTRPVAFSIIPLSHLLGVREELFESVDEGLSRYIRGVLGTRRFDADFTAVEQTLLRVTERYATRAERTRRELERESRAEQYEHWGHLLMAHPGSAEARAVHVVVPDVMSDGAPVRIPLDASRSAVENAQVYYEKARKSREARKHAENRLEAMKKAARTGGELLEELKSIESPEELKAFQERHADELKQFASEAGGKQESSPFRRIPINGEYEVWVGRNARQNDVLTFKLAAKHDYWMHARGLPGSHVILKRTDKSKKPPRYILEHAASIAAWFSGARNSALVPVTMAERKHVRKPRGGPPGLVRVDREEVLLVEPRPPSV